MKLEAKDWLIIQHIVNIHLPLQCTTKNQLRAALVISNKSVRFKKFIEQLPLRIFRDGQENGFGNIIGYSKFSRKTLRDAINPLVKKGFIFRTLVPGKASKFVLNVPKFLEMDGGQPELLEKVTKLFELNFKKEEGEMNLEEVIHEVKQRNGQTRKENQVKRVRKGNSEWVLFEMRDFCKQKGLPFRVYNQTREKGMARHWLRKCEENGIDPKKRIRQICTHWEEIRKFLKKEIGKELNETITFGEYCANNNRKYIDSCLDTLDTIQKDLPNNVIKVDFKGENIDDLEDLECGEVVTI